MPLTWTRLASTASKGAKTLQLLDPIEWNVGDEIVIASTGHRQTQRENEKKTISLISGDKMTLTLESPLDTTHVGVEETFDGTLVEMRAEVGLLTHNVVVRGNQDPQWEEEIKACEAGFNVGNYTGLFIYIPLYMFQLYGMMYLRVCVVFKFHLYVLEAMT